MGVKGYWRIVIRQVKMRELCQASVVAMQSTPVLCAAAGEATSSIAVKTVREPERKCSMGDYESSTTLWSLSDRSWGEEGAELPSNDNKIPVTRTGRMSWGKGRSARA